MKVSILFLGILVVGAVTLIIFTGYAWGEANGPTESIIKIAVQAPKTSFLLGEVVPLDVSVRNEGPSDAVLRGVDAKSGYVKVWIADSRGNYAEYTNAAWGNAKTPPIILKAGREFTSQATILANAVPETAHLNDDSAKHISKDKILTKYAFPQAGVYYVRVVLHVPGVEPKKVESDPIQITVTEPLREDLALWNKMKDRFDLAYFIQEGQIVTTDEKEKANFLKEVDLILESQQNSYLANQVKLGRQRFATNEAIRREALEKLEIQKRPVRHD